MQASRDADMNARAWHSARTFTLLCCLVSVITLVCWYVIGTVTLWQWLLAAAVTAMLAITVLICQRLPAWASALVFIASAATMVFASHISVDLVVLSGGRSEAFPAYKLGALATALIAPYPVWVGLLFIGFCGLAPIVQYVLAAPALQQSYTLQEPWYTSLYAVIACVILHHRLKSLAMERTLARLDAERKSLNHLAGICLALRDLTNTPLQSIEHVAVLLETGTIQRSDSAAYLRRASMRLRQLSDVLASYGKDVDGGRAQASFDAVAVLEQKFAEMGLSKNDGADSAKP